MKTINLETFNERIKVGTEGDCDWILIETSCDKNEVISVTIKEVDGTTPLKEDERWMPIDEFIGRMSNSKIVHNVLKKFIKMGYTIKMEKPKNKKIC